MAVGRPVIIDNRVACDGEDPGNQAAGILHLIDLVMDLQEDLLEQVVNRRIVCDRSEECSVGLVWRVTVKIQETRRQGSCT